MKLSKTHKLLICQVILQILFVILGCSISIKSNVVSTPMLAMLTKLQCSSWIQNFLHCFLNNIVVMFIMFWISYWTCGIVGTLWGLNTSFMIGTIAKVIVLFTNLPIKILSITFLTMELISSVSIVCSSTYFRLSKKNMEKPVREKGIMSVMSLVGLVLLVAGIIEATAISKAI